ncbi:AAA ATPase [Beutenbergia cavernae DSM 12333]|uniref:AAA ATPase n=1 Tax=Beutenbergia cavernae (strain ATCC BAA-8 / DSM 12333 / CCUG 43141 / JCM 11478 / NBRC 16432 / NCIMB 13614 / HKI 0122) TaxID=471853 RepID=C5BY30_BEUC1|nr:DNA polymerase III subunit delta' [Beutenbergia cavernae]ACQ78924.1 AAA ATPase [Beutenbergia cavernae DSM 12333]
MTGVWDDVVGQDAAVAELRDAARDPASMTHAWLVTGPPGSGRSVAARAFAAALQADDADSSPEAANARRRVLAGTHPDVHVAATEKSIITITEARELVTLAQRAPAEGRWRVIVVEDADRMVERTSNVLLKAIEEPPPRTVWLLCAPSPQDVVATIRSRCRQVSLRVPPAHAVADLLVRRHGIGHELALEAAFAAQSHIGLATRLALNAEARERRSRVLELAASIRGVGDAVLAAGELVEVASAQAKASTEDRDAAERAELLHAMGADDGASTARSLPPALRSQLRQLEDDQKRRAKRAVHDVLDRAMTDLLSLYRDVLVVQLGADVELVNGGHAERVRALANASTAEQSVRRMDAIAQARTRLGANVAPLLATEAMAVALRPQA